MAKLTKQPWFRSLVVRVIVGYVRLVRWTCRWTMHTEHLDRLLREGKPFIGAFWHGRMLMIPTVWPRDRTMNMMVSLHGDGEIIAQAIDRFGIRTVRGSPKKGGARAMRELIKLVRNGEYAAITPDGPRGPRMRAAKGVITLARLTGAPILPVSYSTTRRKIAGSWDRFLLPLPFSRGAVVTGDAVHVPADADEVQQERLRQQVEAAMIAVTDQADRLCGHEAVQPAELSSDSMVEGA